MSLLTRNRQAAMAAGTTVMGLLANHIVLSHEGAKQEEQDRELSIMAFSSHVQQWDSEGFLPVPPIHIPDGLSACLKRRSTVEVMRESSDSSSLQSRYVVQWQKPLGRGSYGAVYEALDRKTGERVAVKRIHKRYTDSTTFEREMNALLFLKENGGHHNICSMREHYDEEDCFYLVLDLVSGNELFQEICHSGPCSERDAARLVRELASALAFMHSIGMIHTDLKPENIMLSTLDNEDACIKLVDLGGAHFVGVEPDQDQNPKGTANTPAYCPPEVLLETRRQCEDPHHHVNIDPSFDMWSLGIVIYIMLVGVHPFDVRGRASDQEIENLIISGAKPPLRDFKHAKHLSEDAMCLIESLLEADPEKRLTAHQVLENPWVRGEKDSLKQAADQQEAAECFPQEHDPDWVGLIHYASI